MARVGRIKTKNGEMKTPGFFPVATKAVVKTLDSKDIAEIGFQGVLCNTYHLMLRPGSSLIKKMGGLHKFMNFNGVIATDSGGFQVFSLGKGLSSGVGKIASKKIDRKKETPSLVKVRDKGVWFRSHIDGKEYFLSPEKSIQIQQDLGADIIFAFDECSSPLDNKKQTQKAMERTHLWAEKCLKARKNSDQMLFGIVQGGKYMALRKKSAEFISSLDFDGFGIGGSFGSSYGDSKKNMKQVLDLTIPILPENKPRHLLGIGHLDDLKMAVQKGIDLFDCVHPTRMARHGSAITSKGIINLAKVKFLTDKSPIDVKCSCSVCKNYTKAYISHLFRAGEITAMRLLTIHNLCFFKNFMDNLRKDVVSGKI